MGTQVFAERGKVKLRGDERDIAVSCKLRSEVRSWLKENRIKAEYQTTRFGNPFGLDIWRVRDERQRVLFLLKRGK